MCNIKNCNRTLHCKQWSHQSEWEKEDLIKAHIAQPPNEPVNLTVPSLWLRCNAMREAHNRIRESTHSVTRTQKTYFDKYVTGTTFAVDQHVWLYWPRPLVRQKNKKFTQIWTGQWKITQFVWPLVVKIQHTRSNETRTINIDRLAPCHLPPPETEQEM